MAYASKAGRARISATNPQAQGVCDRCGIWTNFARLRWQFDWRGASLQNLYFLVCNHCYDTPQDQLRAIVVPADPLPIVNARTEPFLADETSYMSLNAPTTDPVTGLPIPSTTGMGTVSGSPMTRAPYGRPAGLESPAIMPLNGTVHYGAAVPFLSVTANGSDVISVTCSAAHGLSTNGQVSVQALSDVRADGFFSVTVLSATAFTYRTYAEMIPAGSLLTSSTSILTCIVGLPLGYDQLQQVGP